jgi:hypothetical protein
VFFFFDECDVGAIDAKLLAGQIKKKATIKGLTHEFKLGMSTSPDYIDYLKSNDTCGVYFKIFAENVRLHVKQVAQMEKGLDEWLAYVSS